MKKRTSKIFAAVMTLVMVLAMTAMMTGCGGEKTLEDVANEDPAYQEELTSQLSALENDQMDLDVAIKENTVTYTIKFKQAFEGEQLDAIKAQFEETMKTMGAQFETLAGTLEEETEVKGISIQIVYLDSADTELYKGEFKAAE